jgi:lipopolysaccharide transport system permease protein
MLKQFELIRTLAWTDFKLKYNRSVLGFVWSLLKPLLMLTTLYIVFSLLINLKIEHYVLFLLLSIIIWNFFAEATNGGLKSLAAKANLIKKSVFQKKVIVISSCLSSLLSLLMNIVVFCIFALVFKLKISIHALIFPFLIIILFILVLGISYALSVLYVLYKDIDHVWDVVLQVSFWITPVVYSLSIIPEKYVKWYILNPLARIINDSRDAIIFNSLPSVKHVMITVLVCVIIFFIGKLIFNKLAPKVGEAI